jgi:hypothetical protein
MGLKTFGIIALLGLVGIAVLSFAQAAPPPDAPGNILDRIAELENTINDLQTQVTQLWGNATLQQSTIESETDARLGADQLLWTNASEQQSEIKAESAARESADANLQSQIDDLEPGEPGATLHFGDWDSTAPEGGLYQANVWYTADTDGFVCARVFLPNDAPPFILVHGYSENFDPAEFVIHPGESDSVTYPVKAGTNWRVVIGGPGFAAAVYKIYWLPLTT